MNRKYKVKKYLIVWSGYGCGISTFCRRADNIKELKTLIKDVKKRYGATRIKLYSFMGYVDDIDDLDLFILRSGEE